MIPNSYLFALCCTLFAPVILYTFLNVLTFKNKNTWVLIGLIVFFVVCYSWFNILFSGINSILLQCVLNGFCSGLFSFILIIFTYNLLKPIDNTVNDNTSKKEYTIETLINMEGVVVSRYNGDNFYLGYLDDGVNTDIVVKIDGNVKNGSRFKIISIENGAITAKLTD